MPNLDELIADWRKKAEATSVVSPEILDELENHLREHVAELIRAGRTELDAFRHAVTQLGGAPTLAAEFQKLDQSTWLPVKVIGVTGIVGALLLAILLVSRFGEGRLTLLLASHVLMVTLGYGTTFLVGALGICFVGQRCFSDVSPARARRITRVTFVLAGLAAGLTAGGVILGMVWAKAEWGRYWAWDIKETGGFAVLVWQACFLLAHRAACGNARNILVLSLGGNIVVSLAWFGGHLLSSLHGYGTGGYWLFLATAIVANLALLSIGLAPAGWLRTRRRQ